MEYFTQKNDKTTCLLCRHYCSLKKGVIGICGVNQNIDGKIKNLVYGYPVSINLDPIEKKPLYHFLPGSKTLSFGTVGCNMKCPFCQNWGISQMSKINGNFTMPSEIVACAIKVGAKSISYTYNEPTIFYPYAKDIGILAKNAGLKNIFVTNGYESIEICEDIPLWLDAANIDLKSFDSVYYKQKLKANLDGVKDTIVRFKKSGIWIEITTLLIPSITEADILNMANFIKNEVGEDTPWHLSAFYPNYKMMDSSNTPIETLIRAQEIAKSIGLYHVHLGNIGVKF